MQDVWRRLPRICKSSIYMFCRVRKCSRRWTSSHRRYGAPTVIAVAFDKNNVYTYPGEKRDSGIEDATIVATHMILASADEGVNSCWLNRFDPDKAAELLGLPQNEEVLMLMDLGYAAEGAGPLPNHEKRKDLTETVTYL